MPLQTKMRFGFGIFLLVLFIYTGIAALDFATLAQYMPLTISVLGLILTGVTVGTDVLAYRRHGHVVSGDITETAALYGAEEAETAGGPTENTDAAEQAQTPRGALAASATALLWVIGYFLAVWLVGIFVATPVFLVLFLKIVARTGWLLPLLGAVLVVGAMWVLGDLLALQWPDYLAEDLLS